MVKGAQVQTEASARLVLESVESSTFSCSDLQLILKFSTWELFFIAVEFAKAALRLTEMDYRSCVNI